MKISIIIKNALLICFLLSTLKVAGQVKETYTGYRVYLADLEVLNQTDQSLKVAFRTVNTGRQDLTFGRGNTKDMQQMIVRFDPAVERGKMQPHLVDIVASLKEQDFAVVAGKISPRREMEVELNAAKNGAAPPLAVAPANKKIEKKAEKKKIKEEEEEVEKVATVEEEVIENTTVTTDESQYYDPETCPDLRIESIRVMKQKRHYVIVEYTIKNVGKGPANLEGDTKSKEDNIAVKAFMTSSDKLTKGALVLGGDVVENRSKNAGPLLPGETHTTKIRIDTNTMTKFTPVVILELDTFGQVRECDETNNKNHIKVR